MHVCVGSVLGRVIHISYISVGSSHAYQLDEERATGSEMFVGVRVVRVCVNSCVSVLVQVIHITSTRPHVHRV